MSEHDHERQTSTIDAMPRRAIRSPARIRSSAGVRNYLIGLALAAALTVGSFWVASGTEPDLYARRADGAGGAWRSAQMGVHLAFFLHITTGPDNTNNALALAFGVLIVGIVIAGSLWIMYHLNVNMMVPGDMMNMRMQP